AERPVADLVVVRGEHHEPVPARPGRQRATPWSSAERRPPAVVYEDPGQGGGQGVGRAEVDVVAMAFAAEQRVDRVVHVVGPLRGHPQTAVRYGGDHRGVVQVRLGDQGQRAV